MATIEDHLVKRMEKMERDIATMKREYDWQVRELKAKVAASEMQTRTWKNKIDTASNEVAELKARVVLQETGLELKDKVLAYAKR